MGDREHEAGGKKKKARVEEAQPASEDSVVSLVGLPQKLLEKIRHHILTLGMFRDGGDDVAALRGTCKALRRAIAPAGKGGKDELTPRGATVSLSRLQWSIRQCGWPEDGNAVDPSRLMRQTRNQCKICWWAAERGRLDVLKWARENGAQWDKEACERAAGNGHLEVLKWMRQNGAPWDEWTCAFAASQGQLEVLKWARENGAPWHAETCRLAARRGQLEALKWARQNGAPWNEGTCANAAMKGELEVLKWARQNGAPWDWTVCMYAESQGHLELVKWAIENGAPLDQGTAVCLAARAARAAR